jgi:FKBP-type peptidyl-prolyl cis-trans isomerase SlyD
MNIAKDMVVSLDVELSDIWGNLLDRSDEPLQYLHGGYDDIFPAVEAALEGKPAKARVEVRLEPADAFGDYDEKLLRVEPRESFPESLEVGMRFEGGTIGAEPDQVYTVTDIAGGKVILDGNHPLAGMALKFVARVVAIRPASAQELEHCSAEDTRSVILRPLP